MGSRTTSREALRPISSACSQRGREPASVIASLLSVVRCPRGRDRLGLGRALADSARIGAAALLCTATAYGDEVDRDAVRAVSDIGTSVRGSEPESCSVATKSGNVLEVSCRVMGYPSGRYCLEDLPDGFLNPVKAFLDRLFQAMADKAPPYRIFDYEVSIDGFSDAAEFGSTDFDDAYGCETTLNYGQKAIGERARDPHVRLGYFRDLSAWVIVKDTTDAHKLPLLFPKPEGSEEHDSPGRVVLRHGRSDKSGDRYRLALVKVSVFPRTVIRCPAGTRVVQMGGSQVCIPDCPVGSAPQASAGTITCAPVESGRSCPEPGPSDGRASNACCHCDQRSVQRAGDVKIGIGASVQALAMYNHGFSERGQFEVLAAGPTLSWSAGVGGAIKNEDAGYGIVVSGAFGPSRPWWTRVYPRMGASFVNYSVHGGSGSSWHPFSVVTAEPGVDISLYDFSNGRLLLSVFGAVGVRARDSARLVGGRADVTTANDFTGGGGLGLRLTLF